MLHLQRTMMLAPLFLSVLAFSMYNVELNNERTHMSKSLIAHDKHNQPVILEWNKTKLTNPDFAASMAKVWEIARPAYIQVEMDFLKTFPDVVGKEPYFKIFEPLFQNGLENVPWSDAEICMTNILKGHFVFDPSKFSKEMIALFENDTCYFISIKDGTTHHTLGFMTVLIRKNYTPGDIKIMSLGVDPAHQNRGLGKLLMSSIFKIIPDIKRIFLCTRITNTNALRAYRAWGFVEDPNPVLDHGFNLAHWTFMHYVANQKQILQNIAQKIV